MAGAALALLLSACGSTQEVSRFYVDPGQYDIYSCPQIADQMVTVEKEGRRLEGLMAKADRDASGPLVSSIVYEPDYLANRGQWRELQKSAAAKNCQNLPASAAVSGAPATAGAAAASAAPPSQASKSLTR